jgi:hypothetical protein
MDENKRIIKIDTELFKIPTSKTKKNNSSGSKPIKIKDTSKDSNIPKNKTVKNKILRFIRKAQQDAYKKLIEGDTEIDKPSLENIKDKVVEVDGSKDNDFNDSVEYLKNIVSQEDDKPKSKHSHSNNTIKNRQVSDEEFLDKINSFKNTSVISNVPTVASSKYGLTSTQIQNQPMLPGVMNIKMANEPPYGCLKYGGLKPTYKEYQKMMQNKTVKNTTHSSPVPSHIPSPVSASIPYILPKPSHPISHINQTVTSPTIMPTIMNKQIMQNENINKQIPQYSSHIYPPNKTNINNHNDNSRIKEISKIKQIREIIKNKQNKNVPSKLKYMKRKKTIKRTFHVGKSKVHRKVAVLVNNKTIRSDINKRKIEIKQTSMEDIRKYLVKHGFIRVGSIAPNDVLKQMYESLHLMNADIKNHNPENMLYNYFNDDSNSIDNK